MDIEDFLLKGSKLDTSIIFMSFTFSGYPTKSFPISYFCPQVSKWKTASCWFTLPRFWNISRSQRLSRMTAMPSLPPPIIRLPCCLTRITIVAETRRGTSKTSYANKWYVERLADWPMNVMGYGILGFKHMFCKPNLCMEEKKILAKIPIWWSTYKTSAKKMVFFTNSFSANQSDLTVHHS